MLVHLELDYGDSTSNRCEVSPDLVKNQDGVLNFYAKLYIPLYTKTFKPKFILVECVTNDSIPSGTVRVPYKLYYGNNSGSNSTELEPIIDTCRFVQVSFEQIPVLMEVSLLLHPFLYDKLLSELPLESDRLSFLSIKYAIEDLRTVIREGDTLSKGWVEIIKCSPASQGVISFKKTKIILVRASDTQSFHSLQPRINYTAKKSLSLQCLPNPVPEDLIVKPRPTLKSASFDDDDDDTLFIFANSSILFNLDIISGSLVKIECKVSDGNIEEEHIARLIVLLEPNELRSTNPQYYETVYVHPRLLSQFGWCGSSIELVPVSKQVDPFVPRDVASSVSLAPVGCWHHLQKMYSDIITFSLKSFFLKKRRVLQLGDLLPITFDSSMAQLCNEASFEAGIMDCTDTLVWFRVENVEGCTGTSFFVDPNVTKFITTNVVAVDSNKVINPAYDTFYDLPSSRVFKYNPRSFPYSQKLREVINKIAYSSHSLEVTPAPILLHSTSSYVGKTTLVKSITRELNAHMLTFDCLRLDATAGATDSTAKIVGYLTAKLESVLPFLKPPVVVFISHLDSLFVQNDPNSVASKVFLQLELELTNLINSILKRFPGTCIICSANNIASLPPRLRSNFLFEIDVPVPDESQRIDIFNWFLSQEQLNNRVSAISSESPWFSCDKEIIDIKKLSMLTAGLLPVDIEVIIRIAKHRSMRSALKEPSMVQEGLGVPPEIILTENELLNATSKVREEFPVNIGAPMIPKVSWEDIGGVDQIKGDIMDTIDIPLRYPGLFATGMKKRSGILFYGPPGTGKTLMAKAIASNFQLNFFSVKGPELLNMYIGESEANVRAVFQKAREAKPCVIFFDEIDSLAPKRGGHGDSGGVMDRIVSQLLAELDGMNDGSSDGDGIFVFGSTNRPDLLDEALLRPGRFDKLLYLGIPDTKEKQLSILKALTRKFELDDTVDLMTLAGQCPFHYTGADFYALCSDAMLSAMSRVAQEVDQKLLQFNSARQERGEHSVSLSYWFDKVATKEDIQVKVTMNDFSKAQAALVPSVSEKELDHYLLIKRNFEAS